MDLRQLSHLLAVAEHKSFSAAARALHTVQSNVSTHVARLEKELAVELIDRRSMELTAEGLAVAERARRVQLELRALEDDIVSMRDEVAGTVRLGCIGTTARWLVPELYEALDRQHPLIHLIVVDATTTSLVPRVVDSNLDLAVVNLPVDHPDLEATELFQEERIVVAPHGHPLAEKSSISIGELAQHELLLTPPGTTFRDSIDAEASAKKVQWRARAEVDGMRLLASLAFQGHGAALLPASAAPAYLTGDWVRVRIEGLTRRAVGLILNSRSTPSVPARAVRDVLVDVVIERGPDQTGVHVVERRDP